VFPFFSVTKLAESSVLYFHAHP